MVTGERGRNPTKPHVGANNYSGVICADFRLVRRFSWSPKRSPAISTYPLVLVGNGFCSGPPSCLFVYTGTSADTARLKVDIAQSVYCW